MGNRATIVGRGAVDEPLLPEPADKAALAALDTYLEEAIAAAAAGYDADEFKQLLAIEAWETSGNATGMAALMRSAEAPPSLALAWPHLVEMVARSKRRPGRPKLPADQRTKLREPAHEAVRRVAQILRDRNEPDAAGRALTLIAEKLGVERDSLRIYANKSRNNREGLQHRAKTKKGEAAGRGGL